MMTRTTETAYAKINLFLDVIGRRENGYHEIDGIMQSISLCDRLEIGFEPGAGNEILLHACGNPDMPTDRSNLAVRAAECFMRASGIYGRVEIVLEKKIPMAGGLAGGSTDAAAVLRALNRLTGDPFDSNRLCELGQTLGADVPFCISGGTARAQGIGEVLTPCVPMPDCAIVVARKGEGISTPWAYGRLDELYGCFANGSFRAQSGLPDILAALKRQSLPEICTHVRNIFEQVAMECRPEVTALRECMLAGGAMVSRMSGSGTAVFGIFASDADAETICNDLQCNGADAFVCRPVGREIL